MIDRRLLGIVNDPHRVKALVMLNEQAAGAEEVAEALDLEPAASGRMLEEMREAGLIEVVGEALNRGAVEPRYRAAVRPLWNEEEWTTLDLDEQQRLTVWVIEMINQDVGEALESGALMARPDSHVSRAVPVLDERGLEEVLRIHKEALDAILAVEAASTERLAETGQTGIPVLSAVFCCEMPPRDGKKS